MINTTRLSDDLKFLNHQVQLMTNVADEKINRLGLALEEIKIAFKKANCELIKIDNINFIGTTANVNQFVVDETILAHVTVKCSAKNFNIAAKKILSEFEGIKQKYGISIRSLSLAWKLGLVTPELEMYIN